MKKIYGFLGAVALLTMASCAKDDAGGPQGPEGVKGDFFMSMNITQASAVNSRTATGDQGIEVGKDRENKVASALIIFATPDADGSGDYTIFKVIPTSNLTPGNNNANLAIFEMDRKTIQDDIKGTSGSETSKTYSIFVVANPTTEGPNAITTALREGGKLQMFFELASDGDTYWSLTSSEGKFLMSSKDVVTKTITSDDVATGTHTTQANALHLGTVEIQRAMSRFDIAFAEPNSDGKEYSKFKIDNGNDDFDVTIELEGVALVNQATKVPLFKVTDAERGSATDGYFAKKKMNFTSETLLNHVITPLQESFLTPFFNGGVNAGMLEGTQIAYNTLTYKSIDEITESDNQFTHTGSTAAPNLQNMYKIWRYCMENANAPETAYEAGVNNDNQVNGNSTGVAFKAKMTVEGDAISSASASKKDIYAYNSVILGTFERLRDYVKNPKQPDEIENPNEGERETTPTVPNPSKDPGIYEMVQIQWAAALAAVNAANGGKYIDTDPTAEETGKVNWKTASDADLTAFETAMHDELVKHKFTVYKADAQGDYYCYYIYWNRHNDNGDETLMAPMEFATVRNNVYKLKVTGINKLGHPGVPGDDPDPNKPDDPDEKDHLYMSVECKVLPWEVRVNDIIF